MRTRIWNELTKAKHDIEYLRVYSRKQIILSKIITVSILVFSSSGVLSWSIWEDPTLTGVACTITAVISLIKLISPYFIMSEKEIKKLDKYCFQLIGLYDRVEQFWYNMEDGSVSENNISPMFYKIVEEGNSIHNRFDDLEIFHINKWIKIADENSRDYVNNIFNT